MIKINLLPVRAARKKENVRRQVSVFLLCVVFTVSVMAYLTISLNGRISTLNEDIQSAQVELKKYEEIAKRVQTIKQELKKLEEKMDIIVKLEANRTGPIQFMDALTTYIIPDKMWLTALNQSGARMQLEGMATDNKTVADFMTNLEGSDIFKDVDLISSKQMDSKQEGRKFKKFTITCKVSSRMPQQQPTAS